jgi:hypothetical protein
VYLSLRGLRAPAVCAQIAAAFADTRAEAMVADAGIAGAAGAGGEVAHTPETRRVCAVLGVSPALFAHTVMKRLVALGAGGLAMHVNGFGFHHEVLPPSSGEMARAWRPYVETAVELFGADRCMFESNFPVDKGMCAYPVLWNAFKRIAAGCSDDEKAALFHRTAARFYRLPDVG